MTYNPFDKPIQELNDASDLGTLILDEVAEGYWIEYKSEFQTNRKIGRSIASLANTYGGWYFVGVEADTKTNVATSICGFSLTDTPDPISRVRDVIRSHIDPIPIFHLKLIELDNNRAVLVAYIPDSQETPFISRDGRIYRRVSDSSDPVPETNRYAVDQLVEAGKDVAKQFERFCRDERTFCEAESDQGWLNLYLSPYPLGTISKPNMFSKEGVEGLIQLSREPITIQSMGAEFGAGNLPFTSGQIAFGSVVLRQVDQASLALNSLTAELFIRGQAKLHIPLKYLPLWPGGALENLQSLQAKQVLEELFKKDQHNDLSLLRFFDAKHLWTEVMLLLNYYVAWLGEDVWLPKMRFALTMEGVWRSVPFCDADEWSEYVRRLGLPVLGKDEIEIPRNIRQGLLMDLNEDSPLWVTICRIIATEFGLPVDFPVDFLSTAEEREPAYCET